LKYAFNNLKSGAFLTIKTDTNTRNYILLESPHYEYSGDSKMLLKVFNLKSLKMLRFEMYYEDCLFLDNNKKISYKDNNRIIEVL